MITVSQAELSTYVPLREGFNNKKVSTTPPPSKFGPQSMIPFKKVLIKHKIYVNAYDQSEP
jgi:hypothetical protein